MSTTAQQLTVKTLHGSNLACPGEEVIFRCETRGSSTIGWISNSALIQFAQVSRINSTQSGAEGTVATLITNHDENGTRILVSTLRVTVPSVHPISSVTCINDNEARNMTTLQVIGKHFA